MTSYNVQSFTKRWALGCGKFLPGCTCSWLLPSKTGPPFSVSLFSVGTQDVIPEMEQWAKWAALASAAQSAHFFISCATSYGPTLYSCQNETP